MLNVQPPHPAGEAAPHPAAVWIDLLNPDETALLARAATNEQRLSHLFGGRDRTEPEPELDAPFK